MAIGQPFLNRIQIGATPWVPSVCVLTPSREIYRTVLPLPLRALDSHLEAVTSEAVQPAERPGSRIFVGSANNAHYISAAEFQGSDLSRPLTSTRYPLTESALHPRDPCFFAQPQVSR